MKKVLYILSAALLITACNKKSATTTPINNVSTCNNPTRADLEKIQIFPTDHPLNTDISASALDPNSAAIIAAIGSKSLHPDFASGTWQGVPIGIPFSVVCGSQTKIPVNYRANSYDGNYGNESEPGPFPIPLSAEVEGYGNGDCHVLTVDIENKVLYELYNAGTLGNTWQASCGAMFDLKTNTPRTDGWTSADAAGLPILPCLIRYDEVVSGKIDHAIRFTLSKAKVYKGYVDPARHKVNGTGTLGASLPMGARLRLKSTFDISIYSANMQVILKAMKTYGIILADIGSDMFISGAPDSRWNDIDLQYLKKVQATDFEVVKLGTIK